MDAAAQGPVIHWFRRDLRLADNPALCWASAQGGGVVPVYVHSPEEEGAAAPGGAGRWWLHHSLAALGKSLERLGSRLILRRGPAAAALSDLARQTGAIAVACGHRHEPAPIEQTRTVAAALSARGVLFEEREGFLLREPGEIVGRNGRPPAVFTPFWRALSALGDPPRPLGAPRELPRPRRWPGGLSLADLSLLPRPDWAGGLRETWRPGEASAIQTLERFVDGPMASYGQGRDLVSVPGTSRLSPYLTHGELSPRQVWHACRRAEEAQRSASAEVFLRQLAWREFAWHLLARRPEVTHRPLQERFSRFRWRRAPRALEAWQAGRTGYPLVDAGMRELWRTGWMHNRARMVAASFLTKHLLISWRAGERWFADTLVDFDLANNCFGWQWTAGCGADAAPYFRIFNPVLQGRRFDREGAYVRRHVPELENLPARWIHEPWKASPAELTAARVALGRDYPRPMVDHADARQRALAAYDALRSQR